MIKLWVEKETSIKVHIELLVIGKIKSGGNLGNILHVRYRICAI